MKLAAVFLRLGFTQIRFLTGLGRLSTVIVTFITASAAYAFLTVWRDEYPAYTILEPALMALSSGGTVARSDLTLAWTTNPAQAWMDSGAFLPVMALI